MNNKQNFFNKRTEQVKRVLREYHERITKLEDKKFDVEYIVKKKDYEVLLENEKNESSSIYDSVYL